MDLHLRVTPMVTAETSAETVALGWTLLHFCWQGTAVAVAYSVVDRMTISPRDSQLIEFISNPPKRPSEASTDRS